MDRVTIGQDLAMVERHVTLGLLHIERQVQISATQKTPVPLRGGSAGC